MPLASAAGATRRALVRCGLGLGLLLATGAAPAAAQQSSADQPYAGRQHREIKALSAEEVNAYLRGEGMGLALAAELNHYPGPRHVLDLGPRLGLSAAQQADVQAIFDAMQHEARELGARVVAAEAELERVFAAGEADEARVGESVAVIAELQGRLRLAHLAAHVRVRRLLTPEQVLAYDRLRGYEAEHGEAHRPSEAHGAGHPHRH